MLTTELAVPKKVKQLLENYGIKELYPPQEVAIKAGVLEGKNLLLASPTASGKTLVAELCAMKQILEKDGKVLYLSPLRALANEKYNEFKKYESLRKPNGRLVRIGISTGEFDNIDPWLERCDVIIATNEKCDSLIRHRVSWIDDIHLLIADEIHLLNEVDRGPTLEVVLARMLQTNPDIQILALSATVRNVEDIAEWLKAIPVTRNWRPINLREGVLRGTEIQFNDGGSTQIKKPTNNPSINLAFHTISNGGQALVFASSRRNTVNLAKKASVHISGLLTKSIKRSLEQVSKTIINSGERTRVSKLLSELAKKGTAFHHAGLSSLQRKIIENSFREGKIKVVTSTPTLAFGVNLPARMVIINNYKRYEPGYGYYPISVLEYKQMVGRAGRPKYDKIGESVLIAKTEEEQDYLMTSFVIAKPERIWSKLGVERILRTHVLSTIASGFARSEKGVYDFFSKTLFAFQFDLREIKGFINKILEFLYKEEMIKVKGPELLATRFGRRVSQLYIDPMSAVIIREGMTNGTPKMTTFSFLHLIAHTPDIFPKIRCSSREIDQTALFLEKHNNELMFQEPDEWMDRVAYESFLGEIKSAWVMKSWVDELSEDHIIEIFGVEPGDLYRLISASEWLLYSSAELARILGHRELVPKIMQTHERIMKGVKVELIPLTQLQGIGRARARTLYEAGLKTIEDLQKIHLSTLVNLPMIGPAVARRIKEQIGGKVKLTDWKKLSKKKVSKQQTITKFY